MLDGLYIYVYCPLHPCEDVMGLKNHNLCLYSKVAVRQVVDWKKLAQSMVQLRAVVNSVIGLLIKGQ